MDQMNSLAMSMLQTAAGASELPKSGKGGGTDEFQKLLDEKTQEKDSLVEQPSKTQAKPQTPARKTEKAAPAQKQENALERAKKLAEQGAWFTQPNIANVQIDFETGETIAAYQPGEYVLAHLGGQTELIPITSLEPWEQLQLQQLLASSAQPIDVSDPEADAILEATAPGADNSPAAMLEKLVDGEVGQVAQKAVETVQPQEEEDDGVQAEVTDMEQAPQRIFHDVQAAPVKVGETYDAEQADEPNVAQQIDSQLIQAMQKGESMVRIQLTPENLGTVTVEISQNADGILHIALSARSSETRGLLERHAADLQGLVSSRTQQEVQVEVQRNQENQQSQNQQRSYDGHNGHPQDGQQERRQQRGHASSQDFMQQLRLGLIPADGEF